jgi:hypothetical protein
VAKFKWGLFIILVSCFISIWVHPYAGVTISVVGYLFIFLDNDVWDRPELEREIRYLHDETRRLQMDITELKKKVEHPIDCSCYRCHEKVSAPSYHNHKLYCEKCFNIVKNALIESFDDEVREDGKLSPEEYKKKYGCYPSYSWKDKKENI